MRSRQLSIFVPILLLVLSISLAACGVNETTPVSQGANQAPKAAAPTLIATIAPTIASTVVPPVQPTKPATEYLPPFGCLPAITITDVVVQACMDKPSPNQNDTLVVTTRMSKMGKPIVGVPVKTTWNYRTVRSECSIVSNGNGIGFCQRNIGDATLGFRVVVEVQYDYSGQTYRGETSFTPAGVGAVQAPTPTQIAKGPESLPTVAVAAAPARPQVSAEPSPAELSNKGELTYSTAGCEIKGNVSYDTQQRIYHVPGGKYYNSTKIDPRYGERWFCTEQDAINNGWRKSKL